MIVEVLDLHRRNDKVFDDEQIEVSILRLACEVCALLARINAVVVHVERSKPAMQRDVLC